MTRRSLFKTLLAAPVAALFFWRRKPESKKTGDNLDSIYPEFDHDLHVKVYQDWCKTLDPHTIVEKVLGGDGNLYVVTADGIMHQYEEGVWQGDDKPIFSQIS